jgi:hypothetical protein
MSTPIAVTFASPEVTAISDTAYAAAMISSAVCCKSQQFLPLHARRRKSFRRFPMFRDIEVSIVALQPNILPLLSIVALLPTFYPYCRKVAQAFISSRRHVGTPQSSLVADRVKRCRNIGASRKAGARTMPFNDPQDRNIIGRTGKNSS